MEDLFSLLEENLHWSRADLIASPIPSGFTNSSYRVEYGGKSYFVRVNRPDPARRAITRKDEKQYQEQASALGVSPSVILCNDYLLVLEFVKGNHLLPPQSPVALKSVIQALTILHSKTTASEGVGALETTLRFSNIPGVSELLNKYLGVEELEKKISPLEAAGELTSFALCHNDPNPWNILSTADKVWLVDWEYAAQSEPFFDIAMLGVHYSYSAEETFCLFELYLSESGNEIPRNSMIRYWQIARLRRGLWNFMQVALQSGSEKNLKAGITCVGEVLKFCEGDVWE